MASAQDRTVSPTKVVAALNQMGYYEVERVESITIMDHSLALVMSYPISVDCQFEQVPMADIEEHLQDAGIDLGVFHSCLAGIDG